MTRQNTETHRKPAPSRKAVPAPKKPVAPERVGGNSQTRPTPEEIAWLIAYPSLQNAAAKVMGLRKRFSTRERVWPGN